MVTNGRLAQAERCRQVTDAGLVTGLSLDQAEQSESRGIGQCLQGPSEIFGILVFERALQERRAGSGDRRDRLHDNILTGIDCYATLGHID